jgi:hypothetical protein
VVPGFDTWGVVTGVLGLLLLAAVRLFSERSTWTTDLTGRSGREWLMSKAVRNIKSSSTKGKSRSFLQYMWETAWAYGAGVMAAHWPP